MGLADDFGNGFAKPNGCAADCQVRKCISVKDHDKEAAADCAIGSTNLDLSSLHLARPVLRGKGSRDKPQAKRRRPPECRDMIKNGEMQIIINTPSGMNPRLDENRIRRRLCLGAYAHNDNYGCICRNQRHRGLKIKAN
ncbi:MAG: hypothetical protein ACLUKN_03920 [Bacilli bacterium]